MSIQNTVIIDGKTYELTNPYLVKDVMDGSYIHRRETPAHEVPCNIALVSRRNLNIEFNPTDDASYNKYSVTYGYTSINNYKSCFDENDEYNDNILMVYLRYTGKIALFTGNNPKIKNEIINRLDIIPGINNPFIYYDKNEIKFLDMPQPYRKFDNTFSKQTLEKILRRKVTPADNRNPEVREIVKNMLKRNIEMGVDSLTYKEFENIKYTYGLELETCVGRFEEDEVAHLNVKAVHDGSLREADGSNPIGGEYVTGVLVGDAGLNQLHEICRVLQTKCKVDKRCGVHVHVGSLNWNKEDVVYSYILAESIEEELFSTLPASRRKSSYCRPVTKLMSKVITSLNNTKNSQEYDIVIDEAFNSIFTEVSGTRDCPDRRVNKEYNHPKGSKCQYDKASQRYCWLNYVTLLFNTKGVPNSWTLEFRPMSGTLNYTKIKNWLKICMAFCSFVENHKSLIKSGKKITLENMLSMVYPKTGDKLISYIRERKQLFTSADESIDYATDVTIAKKTIKEVVCA